MKKELRETKQFQFHFVTGFFQPSLFLLPPPPSKQDIFNFVLVFFGCLGVPFNKHHPLSLGYLHRPEGEGGGKVVDQPCSKPATNESAGGGEGSASDILRPLNVARRFASSDCCAEASRGTGPVRDQVQGGIKMAASSSSTATWSEDVVATIGATPMVRIRRSLQGVRTLFFAWCSP